MLTAALTSSLLLSFASAAAIGNSQQPLDQNGTNATIDHVDQAAFQKFPIEAMSDTVFRLHHHAAKALLSDQSYVVLRQGEIWKRRSEIWHYLRKHDLDCQDWMDAEMGDSRDNRRRIFMSGGRIFDADPERVPQEVIAALQNLADREHENRLGMRCQKLWNATHTDDSNTDQGKMSFRDRFNQEHGTPDQSWMIPTPNEYIQYQIPESVLEDMWKASEEREKQDILAAKLSVRNVELPDLRKCKRLERM
ncbi:hypothetical protein M436DRAFT_67760 [Aureobasidium namibiae CBS 147.97]|uniref:Uncharacterized protein n=1 Tax=Aureobasidium namibiae CBS 147.97 TaxID=1043004 RepID=A0A074WG40_9PEZI